MINCSRTILFAAMLCLSSPSLLAQELDWSAIDTETLQHFQSMVRIDTADPPGREVDLTNYITGVLDAEGMMQRFRVTAVTSYPVDSVPMQTVFGSATGSYLNLITCQGTWNAPRNRYDRRLVVFTEKTPQVAGSP